MPRYNAWKSQGNCEPIEGTDRTLEAKTKRLAIRHLAYEEGIKWEYNDMQVICKDGTRWNIQKI